MKTFTVILTLLLTLTTAFNLGPYSVEISRRAPEALSQLESIAASAEDLEKRRRGGSGSSSSDSTPDSSSSGSYSSGSSNSDSSSSSGASSGGSSSGRNSKVRGSSGSKNSNDTDEDNAAPGTGRPAVATLMGAVVGVAALMYAM